MTLKIVNDFKYFNPPLYVNIRRFSVPHFKWYVFILTFYVYTEYSRYEDIAFLGRGGM